MKNSGPVELTGRLCSAVPRSRFLGDTGVRHLEILGNTLNLSGDKNISILNLSCRTSDLQFSLVLQTHTHTCPLKVYAIKNIRE